MSEPRVLIACGTGGVGKTTAAAALAMGHALAGRRTVVLTIDPARRLADALGIDQLGNEPTEVPLGQLQLDTAGTLHGLMLDRKATWDEVVRRYAPDAEAARALLANRTYHAVSTRLTGSHEFMAVEKLHLLVESGRWEVVVVDTPPSTHAIDFLRAPDRVARLLDQRALSALLDPPTGLLGLATRQVAGILRRLAGETVLADLGEFFRLFAGLSAGFRERGREIHRLLISTRTRCFLVTGANGADREEAAAFLGELRARDMSLGGVFVNRVVVGPEVAAPAASLPCPPGVSTAAWAAQTEALDALVRRRQQLADAHAANVRHWNRRTGAPVWAIPDLDDAVHDLDGLPRLASRLPPLGEPAVRA